MITVRGFLLGNMILLFCSPLTKRVEIHNQHLKQPARSIKLAVPLVVAFTVISRYALAEQREAQMSLSVNSPLPHPRSIFAVLLSCNTATIDLTNIDFWI
jgi:hypothetical protein